MSSAMRDFYARHSEDGRRIFATYWVSGSVVPTQMNGGHDAMDVDGSEHVDATTSQVVIVSEDDLESVLI